jgi:uncharacterized protein (TIGR00297 family)
VTDLAAAVALAVLLALLGHHWRWLTQRGAIAAAAIGTLIFHSAGWLGGLMLASLFVSGSLLTYHSSGGTLPGDQRRTGRGAAQVVANAGWAATGAALIRISPPLGWALVGGALAAAQADTWATEIGLRSGARPRMITTGRSVTPGTSGAVSAVGSVGGVLGAGVLAAIAWTGLTFSLGAWTFVGGVVGFTADSLIGATIQTRWSCPSCRATFERPGRHCGRLLAHDRGLRWVGNDMVNGLATGCGAFVAAAGQLTM